MVSESGPDEYAPADYTDGREQGEWRTRYDQEDARTKIFWEATYCGILLVVLPLLLITVLRVPFLKYLVILPSERSSYPILFTAWVAGTLGGAIFVTKWLYHVVGSGYWNEDRYLWRFLTPPVSGAVSLLFVALISSDFLPLLSISGANSVYGVIGVSFLIGYFSDNAIAKMREIAEVLFGTVSDDGQDDLKEQNKTPEQRMGDQRKGDNEGGQEE